MQKAEERELKKELKRKLAGIFANYVDDIKENNKISRSKIYELIADNMNIAADTVRKYRSEQDGIAEKQAQNLLNACIRFEVENHLRRTKLSKFVDEYKETVEKLIGEPLDIRDPELPYIADYFHIMKREDEKQWNSTVCPPELEKCLNNFFKEKKHLLIVQGTKKSGLTVSVTKYIIDRQKKKPVIVPYIFDIEGKGDKELRDWENLQKALKGEYVIIRIGHQKFEYYDFLRNAKAKIIMLAHNKIGVDNVAGAETVVFNDLVNHIKCTEQMVKMYSSELYEDLKDQKEELKFTLEKIHSITGGLPAAIRKIGSLIWKLYHVDGIGIREIFAEDLWKTKSGRELYETLWKELMADAWSLISDEERAVVEKVACIAHGASKKMMWFLADMEGNIRVLDDILNSFLFMEDGKFRNGSVSYPGVRLFPLMRNLILYKMQTEDSDGWERFYTDVMNRAVEYLEREINTAEMANIYKGKMCFMDREGEMQVVESVLEFCYRNLKITEYMSITAGLETYFSLRGRNDEAVKVIYVRRLEIAKKQENNPEILISYSYIINRCIWRGEKNMAEEKIRISDRYIEQYEIQNSTYTAVYFLIKAKYYMYVKHDYQTALNILKKIRRADLAVGKEDEWKFYIFVCEQKMNKADTKALFQEECRYLENEDDTNMIFRIQYGLFIAERYIEQCMADNRREKQLKTVEIVLETVNKDIHFCKYPVSLQLCSYYVRMACVSALYGKDWKKNFKDAQKAYNRTDRGIWKKRMEEYLKNIEKSVSGEKADFSGENCSIREKVE